VVDFDALGIGLDYGVVRLALVPPEWSGIGEQMAADLAVTVGLPRSRVEHIGSTAAPGVLAKPVLDFAVGFRDPTEVEALLAKLTDAGWLYRGDAGNDGGHVCVLETRPRYRVAHVHLVELDGDQWRRYLALRTVLNNDPDARRRYSEVKLELQQRYTGDNARSQYTAGKGTVVAILLGE